MSTSTVDEAEVARFSALAQTWWDTNGKMAVLHKFNPVRLAYIRDAACKAFGRDARRLDCLSDLRILVSLAYGSDAAFCPGRRRFAPVMSWSPRRPLSH